jgi:hypothetical protein
MATQQTSTEPLRPLTPAGNTSRPTTAGQADTLPVPGLQVDGASDDERQHTAPVNAAGLTTASAQPSRAPSPTPHSLFPHTQITYDDPDFRAPPPLKYTLRTRKKSIFWFWTLIILDCVFMPIGLYFGMWYGLTRDQLSANAVFSISTALLGTVSIVEYFIRFHRLWKKNSSCRVIGAKRWYLDWFHWNLSVGWFFVMIELIAYVLRLSHPNCAETNITQRHMSQEPAHPPPRHARPDHDVRYWCRTPHRRCPAHHEDSRTMPHLLATPGCASPPWYLRIH